MESIILHKGIDNNVVADKGPDDREDAEILSPIQHGHQVSMKSKSQVSVVNCGLHP